MEPIMNNELNGNYVSGTFTDRDSAERAYNVLHSRGYTKDEINVLMSDSTRNTHFPVDQASPEVIPTEFESKTMQGVGTGSAIGGTIGAIIGAVAAIGTSLLLPGIGLIVAGPLAGALAGAGAGGLTGGVLGGLVGAGIPQERAVVYEDHLKNGRIIVDVKTRSKEDADYIEEEWIKYNADKVYRG